MITRDLNIIRVHIRRIKREMLRLMGIGLDKIITVFIPIIELILTILLKVVLIALLVRVVIESIVNHFNT